MNKVALYLLTGAVAVGAMLAHSDDASAKTKKKKEPVVAAKVAKGSTDINDCAKIDPAKRDVCISNSRPVKGADLYKTEGKGAEAAKAAAAKPAPKMSSGPTNIADCAKVDASVRDVCISNSRPVMGSSKK
jgi:hypothetical protein